MLHISPHFGVLVRGLLGGLILSALAPHVSAQESSRSAAIAKLPGPDAEYRLGPGDVLSIDVFGLEELDRKVRISRDGTISLPLLGTFTLAGLSLRGAEQQISQMLKDGKLVRDPQVSIFVEEFVSSTISVQGAVQNPGGYPLAGNKTLLDMIADAGGLRSDAGEKILVLRRDTAQAQKKIEINIDQLTDQGDLSLNIFLRPGDVIMIPPARDVRVYVTGAVAGPGKVSFLSSEGITVLQAITAAGGPTARANLKNVHILRQLPDGTQKRTKVNVSRIQKGKADDVVLQKNDTVVVGEWFF